MEKERIPKPSDFLKMKDDVQKEKKSKQEEMEEDRPFEASTHFMAQIEAGNIIADWEVEEG